eukprot:3870929-Prymnesium_polylepis.1
MGQLQRRQREEENKRKGDASGVLNVAYGQCCDANCLLRERGFEAMDNGNAIPTAEGVFVV